MDWISILAVVTLLLTICFLTDVVLGTRKLALLTALPALSDAISPKVTIIASALNEAETIEPAIHSWLAIDYPALAIIAVNDRSTDNTGAVLDRLAASDTRLKVIHIDTLPDGWLGKSHAMQQAASKAEGDYLLFTDADVVIQPTALKKAMQRMTERKLDHLAVMPDAIISGGLVAMMILDFAITFFSLQRPWRVSDPASRHFVGVGAFNLVRSEAYHDVGMHERIAMHPVDDVMLGKLLKHSGFKQEMLLGSGEVSVAWYTSARAMIRGLEKNTFAYLDYRLSAVLAATTMLLIFGIWPLLALILTSGATWMLNAATVTLRFTLNLHMARRTAIPYSSLIRAPLVPFVMLFSLWNATAKTIIHRGIYWRGTFYPLSELKRFRL